MACLISATFDAFTGVFPALPPKLLNCAEVVPKLTLVPLAAVDDELPAGFAVAGRTFTSPLGEIGKGVLDLSIFTGVTFFTGSIKPYIGRQKLNFRAIFKFSAIYTPAQHPAQYTIALRTNFHRSV